MQFYEGLDDFCAAFSSLSTFYCFWPFLGHIRAIFGPKMRPFWNQNVVFFQGGSDRFWVNSGSCWGHFGIILAFSVVWPHLVFLPFSLPVFCGVSNGDFAFSWVIFWEVQCNIRGNFPPRLRGSKVVSLAIGGIVMQSTPFRNAGIVFYSIYCRNNA